MHIKAFKNRPIEARPRSWYEDPWISSYGAAKVLGSTDWKYFLADCSNSSAYKYGDADLKMVNDAPDFCEQESTIDEGQDAMVALINPEFPTRWSLFYSLDEASGAEMGQLNFASWFMSLQNCIED